MSNHQNRILECAINAAREAACGRADVETAARIYRAARGAGVPMDELRRARRFLAAAERAEGGAL